MVEIQGLAGISVTEDRTQGFADELERKCPDGGIEIIASQPSDFNPDTGLKVMASTGRSSSRTNPSGAGRARPPAQLPLDRAEQVSRLRGLSLRFAIRRSRVQVPLAERTTG